MTARMCRRMAELKLTVIVPMVMLFVLFAICVPGKNQDTRSPVVSLKQGHLQGEWREAATADGFHYAAFRGIPFATAPIGKLRFKSPRPPPSWNDTRKATADGTPCLQVRETSLVGSEDCLFLNVYTPELPKQGSKLLPVLLYVHGGQFLYGSGGLSKSGPDFIVRQGVVVVTINYRLGVFGYLSLDSDTVPGNAGLKDQIAALKWVSDNVAMFGGDPLRITAAGQSAGAASVSWLSLLPASQGLITKTILMSGSAFHSWAYIENFLDVAQAVGMTLANQTLSTNDLAELFMNTSARELAVAGQKVATELADQSKPELCFVPTPERRPVCSGDEPAVIVRDAESYFIERAVQPVPTMIGITNREWLRYDLEVYGWGDDSEDMESHVKDLVRLLPKNIIPYKDTRVLLNVGDPNKTEALLNIIKRVQVQYFGSANKSCRRFCQVREYTDHIFMGMDTHRLAQQRAAYASVPTYVFDFGVRTDFNSWQPFNTSNAENSTVHGEITDYLLYKSGSKQTYTGNGLGPLTLRRFTKMVTNFITDGNPVPDVDEELTIKWTTNHSNSTHITFLHIGEELSLRYKQLPGHLVEFWNDLYAEYRT